MAFLTGIEKLRPIQWSQSYLWDIRIYNTPSSKGPQKPPNPFDEWIPATSVDDQTADVENMQEEAAHGIFSIPKKGGIRKIKITFVDNAAHALERYFVDWMEVQILNRGRFTSTLAEAAKYMNIVRLNSKREIQQSNTYLVIPEGGINYEGSDKADPNSYSVNFVKVGEIG